MGRLMTKAGLTGIVGGMLVAGSAAAQEKLEIVGEPTSGGTGFQFGGSELARDIHWLDGMINIIIFGIVGLVVLLMLWIIVRYNRKRHAEPATFTHNTPIEVLWTIVPIFILVAIGAWSLPILFKQQEMPEADLTIKVTGHQWYWSYDYEDAGFGFDSYMIGAPATGGDNRLTPDVEKQLKEAGYTRNEFRLATDTAVVVPVNKIVVMQVTGADVIHSWTVPAFGVKQDAVPGRLAELWFSAEKKGIYFGQCSELCGINHAFMPITVKVVSQDDYDAWLKKTKEEYAGVPQSDTPQNVQLASAD